MTTRIKISNDDASRSALAKYLAPIEARCLARKISTEILATMIDDAEARLKELDIPKSDWPGARYIFSEGGILGVANRYKTMAGPRGSSVATIERGSRSWYLTGTERREFWPDAKGPNELLLTPLQREDAIRRFASNLKIYHVAA
jgi:hypothetical protein